MKHNIDQYNFYEKILHKLFFNFENISKLLYDLEKRFYLDKKIIKFNSVFISGLARSGSTLLLDMIHSSKKFASLTYNDMPFVLSPNLWEKLSQFKKKKKIRYLEHMMIKSKLIMKVPKLLKKFFGEFY